MGFVSRCSTYFLSAKDAKGFLMADEIGGGGNWTGGRGG